MDSLIKLNVGSGPKKVEGYKNLDRNYFEGVDYICDAWFTPLDANTVSDIYCRQVLEHFDREETVKVFNEWKRILVNGGKIKVEVPDLLFACKQIQMPGKSQWLPQKTNYEHAYSSIFGWEVGRKNMMHKQGFTNKDIKVLFTINGFVNVEIDETARECDIVLTCEVSK